MEPDRARNMRHSEIGTSASAAAVAWGGPIRTKVRVTDSVYAAPRDPRRVKG
jgi:hypothetical protein